MITMKKKVIVSVHLSLILDLFENRVKQLAPPASQPYAKLNQDKSFGLLDE